MTPNPAVETILAQAGPAGGIQSFLPLVLILFVFYFLLVRPQQKQAKEHQEFVDSLKLNDRVVTRSGLFGRVVEVREKDVTLEVAQNVKVRYQRDKIAGRQGEMKED